MAKDGHRLEFCYEAGFCGYVIYRQLTGLGYGCTVAATSMIPRKPEERIKTDHRESQKLAILHHSDDLSRVWVPDEGHKALRDLTRARMDASMHLMRARQQLLAFLLRHGSTYDTGKHWTQRHLSWLAGPTFDQPAHKIVFQDYPEAVWTSQERRDQPVSLSGIAADWTLGPLVEALRALRELDFISSATFVAAIGDLARFESARHLMAFLGLVPSERGGITKTGNIEARRMLIEAAWSYRYPPRVAKEKAEVIARLPKAVRDIAWKAQLRLCKRYRTLSAAGKKPPSSWQQSRASSAASSGRSAGR